MALSHDPEIALTRAICEALQTRCVVLSGTRDDITWYLHRTWIATKHLDLAEKLVSEKATVSLDEIAGIEEGAVFEIMKDKGFRILVVDFPLPPGSPDIACVKVLVPGFASYYKPYSEMGRP